MKSLPLLVVMAHSPLSLVSSVRADVAPAGVAAGSAEVAGGRDAPTGTEVPELHPNSAPSSTRLSLSVGLGYGGNRSTRTGILDDAGVMTRLSVSLFSGAMLRCGVRATGLVMSSTARAASVLAGARIGSSGFLELGLGVGHAWQSQRGRTNTNLALFGQAGVFVAPDLALVASYDRVQGEPGIESFTAGIEGTPGRAFVPNVALALGLGLGSPYSGSDTGPAVRLSGSLTYGTVVQLGIRAAGLLAVADQAPSALDGLAVLRVGGVWFVEAGLGAGHVTADRSSQTGVAYFGQVGWLFTRSLALVLSGDYTAEFLSVTLGVEWMARGPTSGS